jgi:YD repeat-containing protein
MRSIAASPPPTTFEYDPDGRLTKQTDPLGRSTLFAYDLAGRKISQI